MQVADFTRDPGSLTLTGIRARSETILRQEIQRANLKGDWVVADTSLGAWRGHQVSREFAAQLALAIPHPQATLALKNNSEQPLELSYADIIGEFIDAEGRGDQTTLIALGHAARIRNRVLNDASKLFVVLLPRYGIPLEKEDILFIRFFSQALRGTPSTLVLVATDETDPQLPIDWQIDWHGSLSTPTANEDGVVSLVPGIIDPELMNTLGANGLSKSEKLAPLANGHWLVPPERRRNPKQIPRLEFDQLGTLAHSCGWLDAYAQFHGNNMYVDPWFLYTEAQQRFAEGGIGITVRLVERAITCAQSGLDVGILQCYAQGLRVATLRFAQAASIGDPQPTLPTDIRGFLWLSKGWGLVILNDLPRAAECFRQAQAAMEPASHDPREYLYLLNISALCQFKSGKIDQALAMESEIKERIARLPDPDWRLAYVNSINLGRLERRRGQLEQAEQHFRDAFDTTLGVRSTNDAIYSNVVMAKLYASSGKDAEAFTCWMRAGLHWAASNAPEALGERTTNFILGEKRPGCTLPEAIAASFTDSILGAADAAGIPVTPIPESLTHGEISSPVFISTEAFRQLAPQARIDCGLLARGISTFATRNENAPQILGENSNRLRAVLYALLNVLAPPDWFAGTRTIVIDDSHGREIPSTPEELLAACIRLDVRRVAIAGKVIELQGEVRTDIECRLRVQTGCAVDSLVVEGEQVIVFFKRYLDPIILSPEESRLLAMIEASPTLTQLIECYREMNSDKPVMQMLRGLEQKRVINID